MGLRDGAGTRWVSKGVWGGLEETATRIATMRRESTAARVTYVALLDVLGLPRLLGAPPRAHAVEAPTAGRQCRATGEKNGAPHVSVLNHAHQPHRIGDPNRSGG